MEDKYLKPAFLLLLSVFFIACSKSNHAAAVAKPNYSLHFTASDSTINYPINQAFTQNIYSLNTTLITGQWSDTSSRQGSISIRVFGDTTGRYPADSLQITYTSGTGMIYSNTTDSNNFVKIDRYDKSADGIVSGSFACKVSDSSGAALLLSGGAFVAQYQN